MSRLPITSTGDQQRHSTPSQPTGDLPTFTADDDESISNYRNILLDYKWFIAAVISFSLIGSLAYVTFANPVYRANVLVQIEDSAPESKSFLTDTTGLGELKTTASGEIQVLGSRMVIGAAVDQIGLQIDAQPRYLPIVGEWLKRRAKELSDPGLFGLGGYVTGLERITIDRFNVPSSLEDTAPFVITALGDGRYTVEHELLETRLNGKVGHPLNVKLPDGDLNIHIRELAGKPNAEFKVAISSRLSAIERLQSRLIMSEQGRQSNVVNIALEDSDRARLSAILNAIATQYLRQNTERKSAEAEKTLAFLNSQLPVFERQLRSSEDAFARFRNTNGTVAFDEEARVWLKSAADLQTNLLELQNNRLDLLRTNNESHPKIQTLNQQINAVQNQLSSLNRKITAMPNVQRDALRLERDVRANSAQYQSMQNNALQMRLLKEGKVGNVRLLDNAVASKAPIKPQKLLIVAFALALGSIAGLATAIFLGKLKKGTLPPHVLAANTRLELYGVIPQSIEQELLSKEKKQFYSGKLLSDIYPNSRSAEALRSLRIGLKIAFKKASNNRILITGGTAGIGKSFISSNFSVLLSQTGQRVLLIDADLRKGSITNEFGLEQNNGLSELISGEIGIEEALRYKVRPNLDILTTGKLPSNPADLLESSSFAIVIEQLSKLYDHVVIDTAPIIEAADALAIASFCGCVLLVARAGYSEMSDLNESIRLLTQAGAPVNGLLFNGLNINTRCSRNYRYSNAIQT